MTLRRHGLYSLRWSVAWGPFPDSWLYLRLGDRYWQLGSWYIEWGPFPDKYDTRTRYGWYDGYLFRG